MSLTNNCLFVLGALAIYYFLFMSEKMSYGKLKRGGTKHFDEETPYIEPEYEFKPVPAQPKWFSRKKDLQQNNWF